MLVFNGCVQGQADRPLNDPHSDASEDELEPVDQEHGSSGQEITRSVSKRSDTKLSQDKAAR